MESLTGQPDLLRVKEGMGMKGNISEKDTFQLKDKENLPG